MLRFVQIFIGSWVAFSAFMESNWLFVILGGFILYLGISNRGCPLIPGGASCANPRSTDSLQSEGTEIVYEEIKKN